MVLRLTASLACLVLSGQPLFAAAGGETPSAVFERFLASGQKIKAALASIQDKASAKAAYPTLVKLGKQYGELEKEIAALVADGPVASKKTAAEYKPKLDKLRAGIDKELTRLEDIPGVQGVLAGLELVERSTRERIEAAREQIKVLTKAVKAFHAKTKMFPQRLEELLDKNLPGGPYLKDQSALVDPWGRPYQYDPEGKKNLLLFPDIWTQGARPGDPASVIGNWQQRGRE